MNIEEYEKIVREHVARFSQRVTVRLIPVPHIPRQYLLTLELSGISVYKSIPHAHIHSHTPQLIRVQTENLRMALIQSILDDTLGKGVLNVR